MSDRREMYGIPNYDQARAQPPDSAIDLMVDATSLVKRPIVVCGSAVAVGFDPERWQTWLA